MAQDHDHKPTPFLRSPAGPVLIAFIAIAGFFLWQEHRAHLLGVLPYLLLLACPLMHIFMHGGHRGHGGHGSHSDNSAQGSDR
jgi:hypothetical protein